MTTQFYVPPDRIHGDRVLLPDDEARHAARALRLGEGDEIVVVDGEGGWYRVALDSVGRSDAAGHILERRSEIGEPAYHLRMGLGLIKHRGRFETFLEKAVELGASEIMPLITVRTEKEGLNARRVESILIAAMKQCGRSRLPAISDPVTLETVFAQPTDCGIFCHESADPKATILGTLRDASYPKGVSVLVGPEGGFTSDEVSAARSAGYHVVSLGERRLRAETAGMVAAAMVAAAYASQ